MNFAPKGILLKDELEGFVVSGQHTIVGHLIGCLCFVFLIVLFTFFFSVTLIGMTEAEKFLERLLLYTDIKENVHSMPGEALYKKFKAARDNLPVADRKTVLAFHGSPDKNIDSICANGYNSALRFGQAYGPGEYFSTSAATAINYCRGGNRLLLNELLLGHVNKHHTQYGHIIVMKLPAHYLPRFIITLA